MLPVSRMTQSVGMVTTPPWLSISCDPTQHWLWLTSWFQTTPPLVFYPPTVWIPEHTHLIQWEHLPVKVTHLLPPLLSRCGSLHHPHPPHPLPKLLERWMFPEEVGVFPMREKRLPTNHIIQSQIVRAPRSCLFLCPSQLSGPVSAKSTTTKAEDFPATPLRPLPNVSQLHLPLLTSSPRTEPLILHSSGGSYYQKAVLHVPIKKRAWPLLPANQQCKEAWLQPMTSLERQLSPPLQVMEDFHPLFFTTRFSSRLTLLTDYRHRKRGMSRAKVSYGGAFLLSTDMTTNDNKLSVGVPLEQEDGDNQKTERTDKRPVASTPVPGSPWCVVWTEDDRVFFFNPTIHLSVWERPGDLIGHDISSIIKDPPHKRKKATPTAEDKYDKNLQKSKRSRTQDLVSFTSQPGEVQLLPLELRVAHFREMMLERGVSAFSTWEKELHKMVFDPRYLLLTSDQRKQVFDQFVKSRVKDEYKEKKIKLLKARDAFIQLLDEVKITSRSTFRQFCAHYHSDHRFNALNRKQEQEVLFNHYVTSLKKRNKENRARLRKMR